jgi:hypothetical protein
LYEDELIGLKCLGLASGAALRTWRLLHSLAPAE